MLSSRAQRRRNLDGWPCPPDTSAQMQQSSGFKRRRRLSRACFSAAGTNISWGAKRARTAVRRAPGLSGCSLHCGWYAPPPSLAQPKALPDPNSAAEWRDWANFGDGGPAALIAEFALANGLADYLRFRAVCRPWRRCSVDPRCHSALYSRFLPRQWIMLDKARGGPQCRRFINFSTGECIRIDLPELAENRLLALTPEGLLLLLHEPTLVVRLLNPLTRHHTDLPPATSLLTEQQRANRSRGYSDPLRVYGVGLADPSTVAICFIHPIGLVIAKPGDEHWTVVHIGYVDSTLPFAGRFYCAIGTSVMVLNNSDSDQQHPKLLVAVPRSKPFSRMSGSLHLVDNGGKLMLIHRMLCRYKGTQGQYYKRNYEVYRVDLDAGVLVPVKDLGGRAVFMGMFRTISVPAGVFPVSADTLYLGFDCHERTRMNRITGYNLVDGSSEPCDYDFDDEMVHPCSFVDYLSYSIQGNGRQFT